VKRYSTTNAIGNRFQKKETRTEIYGINRRSWSPTMNAAIGTEKETTM